MRKRRNTLLGIEEAAPPLEEAIRSLFSKFRRILELNTRALEAMAEMERALGGDYIFDQAFLEKGVSRLTRLAHHVVYSLNAMTDNRYLALLDRFEAVRAALQNILAGGLGPQMHTLIVSFSRIRWDMAPLVGYRGVCLAELSNHDVAPGVRPLDGFVVTASGCGLFFKHNKLAQALAALDGQGLGLDEAQVREIFAQAELPPGLEKLLEYEVSALFDRLGRETPLRVSVGPAGLDEPLAGDEGFWLHDVGPRELKAALASALAGFWISRARKGLPQDADAAVLVTGSEAGEVTGRIRTLVPGREGRDAIEVLAAPVRRGGEAATERYLLRRSSPHTLLQSEIALKPAGSAQQADVTCLAGDSGYRRGSALLSLQQLATAVEAAMSLERILGLPQEVRFIENNKGEIVIQDLRPVLEAWPEQSDARGEEAAMEALEAELGAAKVLLRGGESAQFGVAAGRVTHVDNAAAEESFPLGGVAVARFATPQFSPILRRASALVTEVGGTVGHLATIAREYRVPAIMGAPGAWDSLPEGAQVTVDAEECLVYEGTLDSLLRYRASGVELYPTDPEYIRLRMLLRLITPLNLLDPDSPEFAPEGCRTVHDLIHFAHERAVSELLGMQQLLEGVRGPRELRARRLELEVPLDIRVLDVEDGVSPNAGRELRREDILCAPLAAFIRGLSFPEMWNREAVGLSFRDIVSAMDKNVGAMMGHSAWAGQNLAIVSRNYLNLSLRLGYHFSVVDAWLCDNPDKNYIYFRFVGGLADAQRRRRRAELIRDIIEGLEFHVTLKADLVVGKLKAAQPDFMEAVLSKLGELTAFTRQLDVGMTSEEDILARAEEFVENIRRMRRRIPGAGS